MHGFVQHFATTLRLHFRNRVALLYGYLFPLLFLVVFWALYRHERVPLLLHMGELLTVSVLGGACFGLPTSLVNERERGVWRRYRITPITTAGLLLGSIAARFVIVATAGALQLGIALAVGMTAPDHPFALGLAFTLATFAFIALGLIIAALADSVPAVQALGQCVFLPMLILGGVAVPLGSLPDWAQHVSAFLPTRYAVESLQAAINGGGLPAMQFDLLALAIIGTAAFTAGVKLFRWAPGQRFRSVHGKPWLVPVFAAWLLVGIVAHARRDALASSRSLASAAPAAPASQPAAAPRPAWERLTADEIAMIDLVVPADDGLVTPIARTDETPDDETDFALAKLEGELPHWPPGRVEDPVQRVRNLLSVAAVLDVLQNPLERFVPLLVQQRFEAEFPQEKRVRLLAWIALHPDEGGVVTDLAELNLSGAASANVVRERVQIYAVKLLRRATRHP